MGFADRYAVTLRIFGKLTGSIHFTNQSFYFGVWFSSNSNRLAICNHNSKAVWIMKSTPAEKASKITRQSDGRYQVAVAGMAAAIVCESLAEAMATAYRLALTA